MKLNTCVVVIVLGFLLLLTLSVRPPSQIFTMKLCAHFLDSLFLLVKAFTVYLFKLSALSRNNY